MTTPSTVALLTDFGLEDSYVGIMKSVVLSICPGATIIDICHEVPPQNLLSGAYLLSSAAPYLPADAVLVGVVDPGVGSTRRSVAIDCGAFTCVGPDNGLFDLVLRQFEPRHVVELSNPDFHLDRVSQTFHGRDIFSPVAGHLADGVALEELGPRIDPADLARLPPSEPFLYESRIESHIIHVDRFGNLITNLTADELDRWLEGADAEITLGDRSVPLTQTFSSVSNGRPLAYFGSAGQLELAVRDGSARRYFGASQGSTVLIKRV